MKNTGGPAFPSHPVMGQISATCLGMTLREYAAIKLKVPDSGTDWLDDMIRKSNEIDPIILTSQQQSSTL
jgi:hypothetical protein